MVGEVCDSFPILDAKTKYADFLVLIMRDNLAVVCKAINNGLDINAVFVRFYTFKIKNAVIGDWRAVVIFDFATTFRSANIA